MRRTFGLLLLLFSCVAFLSIVLAQDGVEPIVNSPEGTGSADTAATDVVEVPTDLDIPVLGYQEDGVPIVDESELVLDPETGEPMPYLPDEEPDSELANPGIDDTADTELPDTPPTEEDLAGGIEVWEGGEDGEDDADGVPIVDESELVLDPETGEPMPYLPDEEPDSGVEDTADAELPDTPPTEEDLAGGTEVWEGGEDGEDAESSVESDFWTEAVNTDYENVEFEPADESASTGSVGRSLSAATKWWVPPATISWDYQLTDHDPNVAATLIDLDLFDTTKAEITALHAKGKKVMCYFSGGSYENWRSDASKFSSAVRGKALDGWAGEQWLNLNNYLNNGVGAIMKARLDLAKSKGCDCVEPDNVDGYTQKSGFTISYATQIAYNKFLATEAHNRGMCIALKNDVGQIKDLVSSFDLAVNEQCNVYGECGLYAPFKAAKKAVVGISYCEDGNTWALPTKVCPAMISSGLNWIVKKLDLPARPMFSCSQYSTSKPASYQTTGVCKLASSSRRLRGVEENQDEIAELDTIVNSPAEGTDSADTAATDVVEVPTDLDIPVLGYQEDGVPIVDESELVLDPETGEPMPYLPDEEPDSELANPGIDDTADTELPDTPPTEEDLAGGIEVWEGDEESDIEVWDGEDEDQEIWEGEEDSEEEIWDGEPDDMETEEATDVDVELSAEEPVAEPVAEPVEEESVTEQPSALQETLNRRHLLSANDVDSAAAAPRAVLAMVFVVSAVAFLL